MLAIVPPAPLAHTPAVYRTRCRQPTRKRHACATDRYTLAGGIFLTLQSRLAPAGATGLDVEAGAERLGIQTGLGPLIHAQRLAVSLPLHQSSVACGGNMRKSGMSVSVDVVLLVSFAMSCGMFHKCPASVRARCTGLNIEPGGTPDDRKPRSARQKDATRPQARNTSRPVKGFGDTGSACARLYRIPPTPPCRCPLDRGCRHNIVLPMDSLRSCIPRSISGASRSSMARSASCRSCSLRLNSMPSPVASKGAPSMSSNRSR